MRRYTHVLLGLSLLALMVALPAHAQEGSGLPESQQAILDQLRQAIAATQEYDSFVTTSTGSTTSDQIITSGESQASSSQVVNLNRVTSFTHDAQGAANAESTFEVEITTQALGESNVVTTTLHAEARVVAGAVYVRAEAETSEGAEPPLLPDGWVQLTDIDEWPALSVLSLDRLLENPTDPELFDSSFYALLDHASEVWSDAPDGGNPQQTGVRVAGEDLAAALTAMAQADGTLDEASAALYAGITDSIWEITVELDGAGHIARIRSEGFLQWVDFDLTLLQPTAPAGSLFTQFTLNESEVVLSEVNMARDPVEAPPLDED